MKSFRDPHGRESGTNDAPWGEQPTATKNSDAALLEFLEGSPRYLENTFDEFNDARRVAKETVAQNFDTKDYEARSKLLQKFASQGIIPKPQTIRDRLRGI
jgi:hypothetical protein